MNILGNEMDGENKILIKNEEENGFQCEKCQRFLKSKGSLRQHIKSIHEEKQSFQCPECGHLFTKLRNLNFHLTQDHLKDFSSSQRIFKCDNCEKTFTSEHSLTLHIKFICKTAIEAHFSSVQSDLMPDIIDVTPKEILEKKVNIKTMNHVRLNQRNSSTMKDQAEKIAKVEEMKYFHTKALEIYQTKAMKTQDKFYENPLPCDHCPRRFKTNQHLKIHIDCKHKNLRYYCKLCPDSHGYCQIQNARLHLQTKHQITKKFDIAQHIEVSMKKEKESQNPNENVEPIIKDEVNSEK